MTAHVPHRSPFLCFETAFTTTLAGALVLSFALVPHPAFAGEEQFQTFFLENAQGKDMQELMQTQLRARKVSYHPSLRALTIGDTPERVALAARLLEIYDKPLPQIRLSVELLAVTPETLRGLRDARGELPPHLSDAQIQQLRRDPGVRTLASPRLSVLEGERARLVLGEAIPIRQAEAAGSGGGSPTSLPVSYQEIGLELAVRPQVHLASDELTLDLDLGLSGPVAPWHDRLPAVARRQLHSQIRVADGDSLLLSGLLQAYSADGSRLAPVALLAGGDPEAHLLEIVVVATATVERRPEITQRDRSPVSVDAEAQALSDEEAPEVTRD